MTAQLKEHHLPLSTKSPVSGTITLLPSSLIHLVMLVIYSNTLYNWVGVSSPHGNRGEWLSAMLGCQQG